MLRIPIKCDGKPFDGDKRGSRDMIRFSFCTMTPTMEQRLETGNHQEVVACKSPRER